MLVRRRKPLDPRGQPGYPGTSPVTMPERQSGIFLLLSVRAPANPSSFLVTWETLSWAEG